VEATSTLAQLAYKYKKFLIHASTSYVFDGQNGPYRETDNPNQSNPNLVSYYGQLKQAAENRILNETSKYAIVRFEIPFGINHPDKSKTDLMQWIISRYNNNNLPPMFSDQQITPISITEFVKAIEIIIDNQQSGIYHIASSNLTSPHQFAMDILSQYLDEQNITIRKDSYAMSPIPANKAIRPLHGGLIMTNLLQMGYTKQTSQEMIRSVLESKK